MEYIKYEKSGPVAYVTLNRPRVLNAMNLGMHEELRHAWDDIETDHQIRLCILTGAGERAFSTGQDLKELAERYEAGASPTSIGSFGSPGWPRLTERFNFAKPTIARVNGHALGGGLELALACDIIVAADDILLGLPEVKLGLVPGAGGIFRLTRQMPIRIALGHLMTGRTMNAVRAKELGLFNDAVPRASLDSTVASWTEDILRAAPLAIQAVKQISLESAHLSLERAFRRSYVAEQRRRESQDCKEGVLAFLQKRRPKWAVLNEGRDQTSPERDAHLGFDK